MIIEEELDGTLVRCAEEARHRAPGTAGSVTHWQRRVLTGVWLFKVEIVCLPEVQAWPSFLGRRHAVRPRKCVQDREPHVWPAELRQDATVSRLNQRMHDALRVDHHLDVIVIAPEEVVRLDHFKGLVHESGGVAGDFGAHVPRGMSGCLAMQPLMRGGLELGGGVVSERPARGGEGDAADGLDETMHTLEEG